ncbi:NACHT domain-containing protein [Shewanella xiamenensis]|uniref:NACHT domain-containing protein n=1 Tax=Shewanella xiamenensis TaxID=332186 RepID=UPI0015583C99|nr:hypothetical protein [Shewanella xiamenensis]
MYSDFYIQRRLSSTEKKFSEKELLEESTLVVVLAEPGGGKTELLHSLSSQLGTSAITATKFVYIGFEQERKPIVIDGFDELAKINQSGIHQLLAQVVKAKPTCVIISSRSSEWDNTATNTVKDFLGHEPLIVRLCDFDESEQRAIFEHHAPNEDFANFHEEVSRFDLESLLPNPQFLTMFTDAYLESGRKFSDKRSIFKLAVERLTKEGKPTSSKIGNLLSVSQKVKIASELFAKLLLSGAEGISINEFSETRIYPLFSSLLNSDSDISTVLATRLFKPGDTVDQHRPVHKIVAEYCSADFLVKRIVDPADNLTLPQCLSIIAPNSTVRDELRGLVGWMAALGNRDIQQTLIELDPYAILANGDPSQLEPISKQLLLAKLQEIEENDPYFRRADFWRRFSIASFFTKDIVEELKVLLERGSDGHLRDLILELLVGSPVCNLLLKELQHIALGAQEDKYTRLFALNCLVGCAGYDFKLDLTALLTEAGSVSLEVAAKGIELVGLEKFDLSCLEKFFRTSANLYPSEKQRQSGVIGERYFIKHLIQKLDTDSVEWLLDALTLDLVCSCGLKRYECDCITGISKIVGSMLDHYFNIASPSFEPLRVWRWIQNLTFHGNRGTSDSKSVQVLYEDRSLREGILKHVFGGLTDPNQIHEIQIHKFGSPFHSHSALYFVQKDYRFLVDFAFDSDNPHLWGSFIAKHNRHQHSKDSAPNELRRHMREQALQKPMFMQIWAKINRTVAQSDLEHHRRWDAKHKRKVKRFQKRKIDVYTKNIQYINEHRELVERGRHWPLLVNFAYVALTKPENIPTEFGSETIVRNALRNCLEFIEPHVPDLKKLAELRCCSKGLHVEIILYASCIEIMREYGNLEGVKPALLVALKTTFNTRYDGVDEVEYNSLKAEVNRLLFPDQQKAELFLRHYLEPQLGNSECKHTRVELLQYDDVFSSLKSELPIEWLECFQELEYHAMDTLFELAARFGERERLNRLILTRSSDMLTKWPAPKDDEKFEKRRKFWFVRAFYFLNQEVACPYFDWLKPDRNSVLLFEHRSGRMNRGEHDPWPWLSTLKIELIMNAFFDKWPKVDLPSHWGSDSPVGEKAYRFLTEIVWTISHDSPDEAIPVLNRMLENQGFTDIHLTLKSIKADQLRKKALRDFEPPTPQQIVDLLDNNEIVTVEGLRASILQELTDYQKDLHGGEFNTAKQFYKEDTNGQFTHKGEVDCVEIIAERLSLVLQPKSISVAAEHQTKDQNRIDITAAKVITGKRRLLAIEAKGQWHKDLYSAATEQLYKRYSIHPDAEQQGIYLVIWFGAHLTIAGRRRHGINSPFELQKSIEDKLPLELRGLIDVFVLDVSRSDAN